MKRVVLNLACLLVLLTLMTPALAVATEAKPKAAAPATQTSSLIVYPEAPPDATAEEARASTEWLKSGDMLNLVIALLSMGAIFGVVIWGIMASRKAGSAV